MKWNSNSNNEKNSKYNCILIENYHFICSFVISCIQAYGKEMIRIYAIASN